MDASRIGERVWIWNAQWQRQYGTAAEYITVPQNMAVPLDDDIDFETAACFGIPGMTAAHGINLVEHTSAETLLITGAASSVGHYATQMATLAGRKVIGTASSAKTGHRQGSRSNCLYRLHKRKRSGTGFGNNKR